MQIVHKKSYFLHLTNILYTQIKFSVKNTSISKWNAFK